MKKKKEITEEQTQNMVNSIMDDLVKTGFIDKPKPDQFKEFGILIPKGKGKLKSPPKMGYKFKP